ncbi:SET domain-containing protein-lysine N-methyltransferase [Propionibacterium freudenreichii]|uniref:SET domain-containing protein-lysine N-methyltransferase n=1 Tax=Propionibacterium freudenreichii TaxID=1744 RepID=UPI0021A702F0|nr:SET domain-containing protein-lysine N-methyltransferase [Propionibacterium freudenreichii]
MRWNETIYDSSQIYVADSRIDGAGLGVFAARSFTAGEPVEIAPAVFVPETETGGEIIAVMLGYGGLYNHSDNPTLSLTFCLPERAAIFTALRDVEAGEELTISCGGYYWKSREDNPR